MVENRPEMAQWIDVQGSQVVLKKPAEFAEEVRRRRVADLDAAVRQEGGAGEKRSQRPIGLRRLWAARGEQRAIRSMRDTAHPEHIAASRSEQADLLASHWGRIFAGKPMDKIAVGRVLEHSEAFAWSVYVRPGLAEVQDTMGRQRDKAPGPDGVPYSAWQAGGILAEQCVLDVVTAMMHGMHMDGLNDAMFVFIPKAGDGNAAESTTAEETRPLALKDSGVKIAAAVVSRSVRVVMTTSVTATQRGVVPGRDITHYIWELDTSMRSLTAEAAEDLAAPTPLMLSFDIKAAFPSLLPEWMAEALAATGSPEELRGCVAALYAGSVAKYTPHTDGRRLPLRAAQRGGARVPASGWLFALAFDAPLHMLRDAVRTDGLLRAGADDVAAACRGVATVERLSPLLGDIEAATDLGMHPTKTQLVPAVCKADLLAVATALRARLEASGPRFVCVAVSAEMRVLGFVLGPEAAGASWREPSRNGAGGSRRSGRGGCPCAWRPCSMNKRRCRRFASWLSSSRRRRTYAEQRNRCSPR